MPTLLHADPTATSDALTRLGLTEHALLVAVREGYLARANCTANHPPLFPSFVAWGETVKALREQLAPMGWTRNDEKNYSRTVHPAGRVAIAVAMGNEATGLAGQLPSTKSAKGPSTIQALERNRVQAWLPGMAPPDSTSQEQESPLTTWLLLVYHTQSEIRSELSLPLDVGDDGRVSVWRERILLQAIPLDPEPDEVVPPAQPDIDVAVRRKA